MVQWLRRLGFRLTRRKAFTEEQMESSNLSRKMTLVDLTTLGIGATLGSGAYVLSGVVAKTKAGPSTLISFLIGAIVSFMSGICYAEFGSRVPRAGSVYIFSYVTVGEYIAFIIGWDLLLEYTIGSASVARAASGYIDYLTPHRDYLTTYFTEHLHMSSSGIAGYLDPVAFGYVIIITIILLVGVKESSWFNNIFTVLNLAVLTFICVGGAWFDDPVNWKLTKEQANDYCLYNRTYEEQKTLKNVTCGEGGFVAFGFNGVVKGAAQAFFGFVGFDAIATTGEEVVNPRRNIPLAIVISLSVIFVYYCGISITITMMGPYYALPDKAPFAALFDQTTWSSWAPYLITAGALCALSTSLLGGMFPIPRVMFSMARDGLIFRQFGWVERHLKTPALATAFMGLFTAILAMIFDIDTLADMMSIGTLLAYSLVSGCVLLLSRLHHRLGGDSDVHSGEDLLLPHGLGDCGLHHRCPCSRLHHRLGGDSDVHSGEDLLLPHGLGDCGLHHRCPCSRLHHRLGGDSDVHSGEDLLLPHGLGDCGLHHRCPCSRLHHRLGGDSDVHSGEDLLLPHGLGDCGLHHRCPCSRLHHRLGGDSDVHSGEDLLLPHGLGDCGLHHRCPCSRLHHRLGGDSDVHSGEDLLLPHGLGDCGLHHRCPCNRLHHRLGGDSDVHSGEDLLLPHGLGDCGLHHRCPCSRLHHRLGGDSDVHSAKIFYYHTAWGIVVFIIVVLAAVSIIVLVAILTFIPAKIFYYHTAWGIVVFIIVVLAAVSIIVLVAILSFIPAKIFYYHTAWGIVVFIIVVPAAVSIIVLVAILTFIPAKIFYYHTAWGIVVFIIVVLAAVSIIVLVAILTFIPAKIFYYHPAWGIVVFIIAVLAAVFIIVLVAILTFIPAKIFYYHTAWGIVVFIIVVLAAVSIIVLVAILTFIPAKIFYYHTAWGIVVFIIVVLLIGFFLTLIGLQPQSRKKLMFTAPLLPALPALSIFCNIYLMFQLGSMTWVRFVVWLGCGFLMYTLYGIWNSNEEQQLRDKLGMKRNFYESYCSCCYSSKSKDVDLTDDTAQRCTLPRVSVDKGHENGAFSLPRAEVTDLPNDYRAPELVEKF